MPFEFKLPDLGEGVREGEIVRWLVDAGDLVQSEQPLVEVMTDKVTAELPSPVAGRVLRIEGSPGDIIPVGAVLVAIDPDDLIGAASPNGADSASTTQPAERSVRRETDRDSGSGRTLAAPAVRRLARDLNVDLESLTGSGPGGRIVETDVRAAGSDTPAFSPERAEHGAPAGEGLTRGPDGLEPMAGGRRIPLRGMRRAIAEHMLDAHRNTAPYTFVEEADFTGLVLLRERVQPMAKTAGVRVTYLPFILAAVSMALREHPNLNARSDSRTGDLLVYPEQHIGVAVHTGEGLVVPVIRNVQSQNLLDLAREIERLSQNARLGRLTREDMLNGTFTVTSLGPLGGVMGTPMLNTPQVAVLGVHKIAPRPVAREGAVVVRQTANLSLTLDHRYIDGYVGASFAQSLVKYLEDPALLLFWLAEMRG